MTHNTKLIRGLLAVMAASSAITASAVWADTTKQTMDMSGTLSHSLPTEARLVVSHQNILHTMLNPGDVQRAALLGVQPGKYTPSELSQLEDAQKDGDSLRWDYITSGTDRMVPNESGNAGKAQLAAILGVDNATHTLNQMTYLQSN